ncbi:MAG: ABC transporter permease subunit [Eubacteriales bacterium]|nr:ABC transporter permease subunit [Eubacteriales bacterium]
MKEIIKYEFQKIWSRKIVWTGLLLLLLVNLAIAVLNGSYHVVTSDGRELFGSEAEEYVKERTGKYTGLLNDDKAARIIKEEKPSESVEYGEYYGLPLYNYVQYIFGSEEEGGLGKTVDDYTRKGITLEVGHSQRWISLFSYLPMMILGIGTVAAIGVSGVFSEEYTRRMDALLLTSKNGKRKCIYAKIIASFLFALVCYGAMLLVNIVPFLLKDGIYGWDAAVQLSYEMCRLPYTFNCGQTALCMIAGGLLGTVMITSVTLIVSVLCKSSFAAIIISFTLYVLPMLMQQLLPMNVVCMTPLGASTLEVLQQPFVSLGGLKVLFYLKIIVAAAVLVVIMWFVTRRVFSRHQVQ